jgi:hypothetical protein
MSNRAREIEALTDALLDDLMNATDNEILDEAIQDGTDVESAISFVQNSYNKAKFQFAKDCLASTNVNAIRQCGCGNLINIADVKRKVIDAIIANPEFNAEFTLAARSGKGIPDEDVAGIYDDLVDLGLIDKGE